MTVTEAATTMSGNIKQIEQYLDSLKRITGYGKEGIRNRDKQFSEFVEKIEDINYRLQNVRSLCEQKGHQDES